MATKDKENMTVSEALNVVTNFKNLFRAAEKLEDALLVVVNRDNAKNVTEREAATAVTRKKDAERDLEAIQKEVKDARAKADKELEAIRKELAGEKLGLEQFKTQCKKETDDLRASHDKARQLIVKGTEELEAKRSNLARDVRELEGKINPSANPPESRQARIER